jgi:peptidoglycan/LPS O-acetylase OafA/YrhL
MNSRLLWIDALRGLSAVWVFAYHFWNVFAPGYSPQGSPKDHIPFTSETPAAVVLTYPLFAYGYTSVGLFFVLSGFCIHLPQARRFHQSGSDQLNLGLYARRRFWRLYPAYAASLILGAASLWAMTVPTQQISIYLLINTFFLLAVRPDAITLGPVYWTLWYELQFYLLYPLLLKLVRRIGFAPIAGVLLVAELAFALLPVPEILQPIEKHFEWLFIRRYFEWFLGMWLAERVGCGQPVSKGVGGAIALCGATLGVVFSHLPGLWALHEICLAVASFGIVAFVLAPKTELWKPSHGWLLRSLSVVGISSYSLYLIHMPVMRLMSVAVSRLPGHFSDSWKYGIFGVASLILVPLVSVVWYRLFEKPFLPQPAQKPELVADLACSMK